ncbi:unnamed protein product [Closterium sp. Naga37s-1]|nr:unnamed protein product [Closterium sp. Naga37s-1]
MGEAADVEAGLTAGEAPREGTECFTVVDLENGACNGGSSNGDHGGHTNGGTDGERVVVEDSFKDFAAAGKSVFVKHALDHSAYDLTVVDLTYKVVKKAGNNGTKQMILLNKVNAKARHGQVMAIVGPSGAGKSTFLDAIAGRISQSSLDGEILVNGKPVESSFKRVSGYVMQDDQLFPMLSVRETLMFSARLRLPATMSLADKKERVSDLIDELGLTTCANTIIGNAEVRGVSGGERRRVSIGVDLIHDPAVLFLDEPTSGLDSTAALNVMQSLHDIATHRLRTIILTIHQPSFRILDLIHNFLVLAKGSAVYHGSYPGMLKFFEDFGTVVPEHVNALEYALDMIEEEQQKERGLDELIRFSKERYEHERSLATHSALGPHHHASPPPRTFATPFLHETLTLADRNFKNIFRTPELFLSRIGLMVITGLILGSLFLKSGYDAEGITNRASFFAFALALLLFTSTEGLPIFLDERQIYIRETSRGAYRTGSYVLAGALVFLPFLFLLSLLFSCVAYFMVGLAATATAFFRFVATVFLTLAVGNSFVVFFAAFVPNYITGNTVVTAITAFFFLFSGFFISKNNIPPYWIWMNYLSTFKYPLEMLTLNEYGSLPSVCWEYLVKSDSTSLCIVTSDTVIARFDMADSKFWESAVVMVSFFIGYRILFYFALRYQTALVRK